MDFVTVIMLAVLVLLVFFMFRNNKKRQNAQRELQESLRPGARIMTNFGLYGTLVSINDEDNTAIIEVLGGTQLEVHRQTVARVVEPVVAEAPLPESLDDDEPKFGERTDEGK